MLSRGKSNKKFVPIVIVTILVVFVMVIVFKLTITHIQYEKRQIQDTNGDSKELCYFTNDLIENSEWMQNYDAIRRTVRSKGSTSSSGVAGHYAEKDKPYISVSFGKISGIYVGNAYLGNDANVTFEVKSTVEDGNFRIVITDENNRILYDIPIDQKADLTFFAESGKTYYLKYIAESAKVTVEVWRS